MTLYPLSRRYGPSLETVSKDGDGSERLCYDIANRSGKKIYWVLLKSDESATVYCSFWCTKIAPLATNSRSYSLQSTLHASLTKRAA